MLLKLREDNSEFLLRDRRCVMFFFKTCADLERGSGGCGCGCGGVTPLEFAMVNIADISGN